MVTNIVNFLSRAVMANNVQTSTAVTTVSNNPFANPVTSINNRNRYSPYSKNEPVPGGYFAGYYRNRINTVGAQLWVLA